MAKSMLTRIASLGFVIVFVISSIGAAPFKINGRQSGDYSLEVPEVEYDSFVLEAGAASELERDVEITEEDLSSEEEVEETVEVEEEKPDYSNFFMASVQDFVNVRKEPNTDCEIVGKLYKKCGGDIIERGDGWTHIKSGELEGWVRNDFLLFGDAAREFAVANCERIAIINVESLRIRKGPGTEYATDGLFEINSEWNVIEELGDWVSVEYKGNTRYVAAEYVNIELFIEDGETMEEIRAREAIAAQEKAKLTANQGAYSASVDEATLLGAIIQAEAGNQCYEGKIAVGAVVLNRVKSPRYPNTIAEVIYAPGQFGPASNGTLATILANGVNAECMQAANEALAGATTVGDAKSFHRAGSDSSGVVIGAHVFY